MCRSNENVDGSVSLATIVCNCTNIKILVLGNIHISLSNDIRLLHISCILIGIGSGFHAVVGCHISTV